MPELIASSEDTRVYEVCVLYPHPLGQKEEAEAMKAVEALFDEADAKLISKDVWGRRGLAYKIGGYTEGNYVVYYYDMDPSKLKELDTAIRIVPNVLRHIMVKPPKGYQVVEFSAAYDDWRKQQGEEEKVKEQEKEERLKKKMLAKQKTQAKRSEPKAEEKKEAPTEAVEKEQVDAEIEKLIADDDLEL